MPLTTDKAPASASPLWIIALFIALSEATAGAAAAITNGVTRLIFACFAVTFPVVVFVVFTWLLIKHAPKLYAPGQYSREITPEIYRTGINRADATLLGRAVARTVVLGEADSEQDSVELKIDKAARIFEAAFEESTVEIEPVPPGDLDNPIKLLVMEDMQVWDFLNQVWFELEDAVEPYTYNQSWVLTDKISGTAYTDIGRVWAKRNRLSRDSRTISEIGIKPGSKMKAMMWTGQYPEGY